jgi:hypothetical protein
MQGGCVPEGDGVDDDVGAGTGGTDDEPLPELSAGRMMPPVSVICAPLKVLAPYLTRSCLTSDDGGGAGGDAVFLPAAMDDLVVADAEEDWGGGGAAD